MFVQLLLFVIAHCGTPGPLVRVEVRSGSLAKLFLWSSLSFRKLAFPLEKPSREILVVQSSGACEMSARRNHWQERELWNGSSIDRVSGRRELLPSASEQILFPLRFQETRGGSGACHFGFKAHPPALLSLQPNGSSHSWPEIEFCFSGFYCSSSPTVARRGPWSG